MSIIKTKIKRLIRKNENLNYRLHYLKTAMFDKDALERKVSYGSLNPDKTIYIIRPTTNGVEGLMSLFLNVMRRVNYAYKKGYIPVVDMKNYHTQYEDGSGDNVWERYFSQPDEISLEEAYKSKNVILSGFTKKIDPDYSDIVFSVTCVSDDEYAKRNRQLIDNHIAINEKWNALINEEAKKLDIENCIGVYVRGTDYLKLKAPGERIQPDVSMVIEKTKAFANKYQAPVYVVTEDQLLYKKIADEIPNVRTVSNDIRVSNYNSDDYLSKSGAFKEDKQLLGGIYLTKIILLSRCKYYVGGVTAGSIACFCFNGARYEDKHVFNLGSYS